MCVLELGDNIDNRLDKTAFFFPALFGKPLAALAFALPKDCLLGKDLSVDGEACCDDRVEKECTFLPVVFLFIPHTLS